MSVLADNDVILKGACYGLLDRLFSLVSTDLTSISVLGAAKFVVSKSLRKKKLTSRAAAAAKDLDDFMSRVVLVEPTETEQFIAADLELLAQRARVALDTGESQLCAVLISRGAEVLTTGDKRAVEAIETLLDSEALLNAIKGKIRCLEQLVLHLAGQGNVYELKAMICAEPTVDKTLTICFSCGTNGVPHESFFDGLRSYINDLRARAPRVLAA